jgi:phosphatidylinositol glycan class H protein
LRLLILSTFLFRLIIGLSILFLLYSKYTLTSLYTPPASYSTTPPVFSNEFINYGLGKIVESAVGKGAVQIAGRIPLVILGPMSLGLLYAIFLPIHTEESLLVLRGLGIQTSTSSETYLSTATTRFIPTEKIQDIFVNEAFRGFEVRYLLVVVVEGEEDVVVVFPRLLPGRRVVETVWRGARGVLGLRAERGNANLGDGKDRRDRRDREKEGEGWRG